MKQVILQSRVVLTALLVVFVGGCAANMVAPPSVEDRVITQNGWPQYDTAQIAASAQPVLSEETQIESGANVPEPPANKHDVVPGGASGIMIYVDPRTGAIRKEPAPGTVPLQLTPEIQNAMSTSHQGLREVPNALPGGGFKLDLQGRFQSPLLAAIDAGGQLRIQHLHDLPESGDEK